jgi:hypothetical protein
MLTRCPISTAIFLIVLVSIVSCAISPVLADVNMWMSQSVYALEDTIIVYWDWQCAMNGGVKLTFVGPYRTTSPTLICESDHYVAGVAEPRDVGDWVVYGEFTYCSDVLPIQCSTLYGQTSFRVESSTAPVCSEGAVNVLETCSDGSWKHRQVCRNNAWTDEYQQCPTPPPTCSGGQYWNGQQCVCPSGQQWNGQQCVTPTPTCSDGQYWDGSRCVCPSGQQWNGQQCVTPQVCSEGAVNVLETCSDGSWSHRQICRNNAWHDEYQQCPAPPSCSGGQYWNGAQCVCPSGQQWNGQQCTPTQTAYLEVQTSATPQPAIRGQMMDVKITLKNDGPVSAKDVQLSIDISGIPEMYVEGGNLRWRWNDIPPGSNVEALGALKAKENTGGGSIRIPIVASYKNEQGIEKSKRSFLGIRIDPNDQVGVDFGSTKQHTVTCDSKVFPGQDFKLDFTIRWEESGIVTVRVTGTRPNRYWIWGSYISPLPGGSSIEVHPSGSLWAEPTTSWITMHVDDDTPAGTYYIKLEYCNDKNCGSLFATWQRFELPVQVVGKTSGATSPHAGPQGVGGSPAASLTIRELPPELPSYCFLCVLMLRISRLVPFSLRSLLRLTPLQKQ